MSTDASSSRTRTRRNWAALAVGLVAALLLWFATSGDVPREVGERVGTAEPAEVDADAGAPGRSRTRARAAASEESAAPAPESTAPQPASSAWRFTVVADEDGAPIAGAVIAEVYQDAPRDVATTGSDGTCELAEVGTRLRASAPGRIALVQDVRELKEREYSFRLVAAGVVRGRVDKPDGTPAADVGVRLLRGEDVLCEEATTGADGRFEFRAWPFGACGYVEAGRPSLAQIRRGRARPGDDGPPPAPVTSETFRLSAERPAVDLVLRLGRRATLVLSALGPDGAPAKGPVDFRIRTTRSGQSSRDASPQREIPVDPGRVRVDAAGPGGVSDAVVLTVRADDRVERVLQLRPAAAISGTVIGADGRPAAGAEISWREALGSDPWSVVGSFLPQTRTDAEGRFVLDGVRPGRYVAAVRAEDRSRRFDVAAPAEGVVLRMDMFANVRFVVRCADAKELPRFARVGWSPGDGLRAWTQDIVPAEGVWIARVPSGPGIVRIELLGTPVVDREIDIVPGQTLDLGTVEVARWRTLAGRVLLADGRPAPPLTVVQAQLDGDRGHVWKASAQIVTRDGRFEMRARDAEGVVVFADLPGHALALMSIPREGDVRDIELQAVRGGTVRLRVVRGDAPARDASWTCGPAPQGFARVEADGVAERRCVPGPVRVVVRAPGAEDVIRDVLVTEGETTDVDVTLPE